MKIKKFLTATLAAVLCVTGVSFSASAVEPRHEHSMVCTDQYGHGGYWEVVGEPSTCAFIFYTCTLECSMQGCGYTETVPVVLEVAHDWSNGSTCSNCGYQHPLDVNSVDEETHTH